MISCAKEHRFGFNFMSSLEVVVIWEINDVLDLQITSRISDFFAPFLLLLILIDDYVSFFYVC